MYFFLLNLFWYSEKKQKAIIFYIHIANVTKKKIKSKVVPILLIINTLLFKKVILILKIKWNLLN